jgi:hypothetical protein
MREKLLILLLFVGGVELSAQTIVQQFAALSSGGAGEVSDMDLNAPTGVMASINGFIELSNMPSSSVLDGSGVHLNDGTVTSEG